MQKVKQETRFAPPMLKRTPLVDQAVAVIENAILRKKLPAGFRLKEEELASSLGISRSPLREAIQRLIAVGLLRTVPPRGVCVAQITRKKVSELMAVREVLEGLAARLAAERLSKRHVAALRQAEDERKSASKHVAGSPLASRVELHSFLAQASGNSTLEGMIKLINRQLQLARLHSGSDPVRKGVTGQEHLSIIRALERKDAPFAEEQMRLHIRRAHESMLRLLPADEKGRDGSGLKARDKRKENSRRRILPSVHGRANL